MAEHNQLGEHGEALACTHLEELGYRILERNWRYDRAEIDIIAEKEGLLVVVEVKTRNTEFFGRPSEFVSERKQELLMKAAEAYLESEGLQSEVRFDIVGIVIDPAWPDRPGIRHIPGAFSAFG